jgi:nicotinate phosphoribosyltransferase
MTVLDNDLYQLTMSQYAWRHHRDRVVRYRFRNRTFAVPLGEVLDLDELRRRLDVVSSTGFTDDDIHALRRLGLFDEEWLGWLGAHGRTLPNVEIGVDGGHLEITYEGPWPIAIFLETPVLATVSELHGEAAGDRRVEGDRRLDAKIRHLRANPDVRFMEFGTRRRHGRAWQAHVLQRLLDETPLSVLGTSNVELALAHGIPALGTMAHQLFMVATALALRDERDLLAPSLEVVERWSAMFPSLRTLLPDTYTTRAFTSAAGARAAARWPAVRIDSGDPMAMGDLVVEWWQANGEDVGAHQLVFSDGLDLRRMDLLLDAFAHRCSVTFGWGTNLTNDVGVDALSLVIKPDAVDGVPCVKLSDDLAKATGDRNEIARYVSLVRG